MNDALEALKRTFPEIEEDRWPLLEQWGVLMREWNQKINVVSRKDIENIEAHHLAPCLVITRYLKLMQGGRIMDVGTGGGLPGLPMAICYPQAHFTLLDSVGKKLKIIDDIAQQLNLRNITTKHARVESIKRKFDFVTGRAVADIETFLGWNRNHIRPGRTHSLENGVLYWRGGAVEDELAAAHVKAKSIYPLSDTLDDPYFKEKYILHILPGELARIKPPQ